MPDRDRDRDRLSGPGSCHPALVVAHELGIRRLPPKGWRRRARYELRYRDGGSSVSSLSRLDDLLDARRYPADYWATVQAADELYESGDDRTFVEWASGPQLGPGVDEEERESFRQGPGWIVSTRRFKVRALGRAGLEYADEHGTLTLDSEFMATPAIVLYAKAFPLARPEAMEGVRRAWLWRGFDVDLDPLLELRPTGGD